ncbi:MAG: hypothetical protein QNJ12_09525 [Ilumatobacter sp.]|uniref:SGNH/GDSL hydrolase family protein n=1 Tax=Ilumatobacter sp. TaxID=1967498 RepID=UPI00262924E3|nr:hypothetical protein [Ilumatobacter sp.]MDJ0769023.1 hypothetical protein [Ilumatobacter sp.]
MSVRVLALAAGLLVSACAPNASSQGVSAVAAGTTPEQSERVRPAAIPAAAGESAVAVAVDADPDADDETADPVRIVPEVVAPRLPGSVAVVGDSLTLSAAAEIETAMRGLGLDLVGFDAMENRRMVKSARSLPAGVDAIDEIVAAGEPAEVWVIALGTNDIGSFDSAVGFGDDVTTVLRHVPRDATVIWVDLWIRDRAESVAEANEVLRSVVGARRDAAVVDWFSSGDDEGVITGDGVHLTEIGRQRFAEAMADGIVAHFSR